ncbi:MAG: TonB-dependent receptor plug domain-containing protein [Lutibacter sp.]
MRILLLIVFISFNLSAQKVTVLDFDTKKPIENVGIVNDDLSTICYTNSKGEANLKKFKENDVLSFNHLSYVEYDILKKDLKKYNYEILLNKKAEELNEIILSASKEKEKRGRIAEQVDVVTKEEIVDFAPQTSADLLANLNGVKVQKSQFGGGSPVLRGMEANRVLLVIDGVRMNNAIYRTGHLQNAITVSPNIIDRTEVIFGPSSVIYGSDALGGIIHYYTKTPKLSATKRLNSSVYNRLNTVNNEVTLASDLNYQSKKWASYTNISFSKFGDLVMGKNRIHGYENWGKVFEYSNNTNSFYNQNTVTNSNPNIQKNTGYKQVDLLQKLVFALPNKNKLILNSQYSTSTNINRFDKLNEYANNQLKFAEWYYGPQQRLLFSTQLKINSQKKWLQKGSITAAFQDFHESRIQRKFSSLNRSYRKEKVNVYSLNGDFFVPLTLKNKRILSYGFEANYNKVYSKAYGKTLNVNGNTILGYSNSFKVQSRYPDGGSNYTTLATYVNYRQNINKKTTLNSGIRFSYNCLNAKWIDQTFISLPSQKINLKNKAITAALGMAYKPNKKWQLNTVISSGFRAPNVDDVGKIREKNGKVTVPNTNLRPEYAYNFEINGLRYFNNHKFNTNFNFFYTLLNQYITRDYIIFNNSPTIIYDGEEAQVMANINKKNAYILGGTLSFQGNLGKGFKTNASFTYTKGKALDTKLPLSSIPPLFGNIKFGYKHKKIEAGFNWIFNGKKSVNDYNLIEGKDNIEQTPFNAISNNYVGSLSWNTLNFKFNYQYSKSISVFFKTDNIFDVYYKEFASSISAPGRNFSFAILFKS